MFERLTTALFGYYNAIFKDVPEPNPNPGLIVTTGVANGYIEPDYGCCTFWT